MIGHLDYAFFNSRQRLSMVSISKIHHLSIMRLGLASSGYEDRPNLQGLLVPGTDGRSPYQEPWSGSVRGGIVLCNSYQAS